MNILLNKVAKFLMVVVFLWAGLFMLCAQLVDGLYIIFKEIVILISGNDIYYPAYIFIIVVIIVIIYGCKKILAGKDNISVIKAIFMLILLTVVPRYYLLHNVSIIQTSDYATYLVNSMSIHNNYSISPDWQLYFGAVAANVPIICGIFAIGFKLFGASLSVGLYMNVFFYTGAVIALYFIALSFTAKNSAFLTATIYALWPNNIAYSVSMASEPMYIFLLLSGLALFIYGLQTRGILLYFSMLFSGALLGLSQAARPITLIFIFSIALIFLFFYRKSTRDNKYLFKQRVILLSTMAVAYMLTLWGLGIYTNNILPSISKPSYGWSFYEGININTYGQWDAISSAVQDSVIAEYPIEQVQTVLFQKGIERIKSYDSKTLALLFAIKTRNIFGNSDSFYRDLIHYSSAQPSMVQSGRVPMAILSWGRLSIWLYKILALAFIYICIKCLYTILFRQDMINIYHLFFMILPITGIMAIHLLITSIERYNYPAIPFMIMLCISYFEKYPSIRLKLGAN